ncbi:DUF4293 family protein [Blattabacterium cuenoti]|uniref:Transmembrane protein n=1 Tax=Blattabacterium cuenoti STAT TaxID=1457030 RepID=A0A224AB25_9FLAO|nr:DUF4293 family protein [Blattabacterium cuenoti]BBA17057.1 hypothetical protein STAT_119 [Blattabacterium cuenoti STAT]
MLYRIQTLYLLISIFIYSIFIYFLCFLNNKNINIIDFSKWIFPLKKTILIFLIICLFLSVLSFSLFHKKRLQIIFNKINIFINAIHKIILFFSYSQWNKYILIMFLFFVLSITILYLTNKTIKKDIELIDSINRIR